MAPLLYTHSEVAVCPAEIDSKEEVYSQSVNLQWLHVYTLYHKYT